MCRGLHLFLHNLSCCYFTINCNLRFVKNVKEQMAAQVLHQNTNNVKTRLCTDYKGVRVFEVKNVDKV